MRIILLCLVCLFAANPVQSQVRQRVVQWADNQTNYANMISSFSEVSAQIDALEIVDVAVGGKSITLGESFATDDEWLKNLTVRIKNVSNLTFSTVQMNFFLPEIMPDGPMVNLCYGCGGVGTGETISPGEEVELKLVFYSWVVDQINKKSSLAMITRADIWDFIVTPENGKKWMSSCMKTLSQKNACPKR